MVHEAWSISKSAGEASQPDMFECHTCSCLPVRFLGVSIVDMPQWAPFGDGGRNCPGIELAVEEAKVRGNNFRPLGDSLFRSPLG